MSTLARTSMFNLTRPTASVNDYVTRQRYKNHFIYLKNLYLKFIRLGFKSADVTPILFELRWCYNVYNNINDIILSNENGAFAFGLPVVGSTIIRHDGNK